ncbi:MAG TPA: hypothetical protein ENJ20_01030 [Bacteroidetes bacterium]|nr:hypothetical protein [Bacteroidota bacterium]
MSKQTKVHETSIFQKFLNAKSALTATIQKILDLNKSLRSSHRSENQAIKQELKLLNKVADQQAKIVQLYEMKLKRVSNQ